MTFPPPRGVYRGQRGRVETTPPLGGSGTWRWTRSKLTCSRWWLCWPWAWPRRSASSSVSGYKFLYTFLPYDSGYEPYDWTHVLTQTQLLFFSALAFTFLKLTHLYPPELRSTNLDVDWIYRRLVHRWCVSGGADGKGSWGR